MQSAWPTKMGPRVARQCAPCMWRSRAHNPTTCTPPAAAKKGFGTPKPATDKSIQTCPCGSRKPYKDCCGPHHAGSSGPPTAEAQLRARFSAFVKGEQDYIVRTFHPVYLAFKYPGTDTAAAAEQLKLDVKMACTSYTYSGLRVLATSAGVTPDEAFVEFTYRSAQRATEQRTNSRHTRVKAGPVDRRLDGSVVVADTVERSRFLRDEEHGWRFADYELIKYPDWMAEAKSAELASRQAAGAAT